ncbi:DUF418 domain-containing protein [Paenibacillus silvisoli]|uniref:DUF418 domain-containing protein n=1 Tax=Paenibacillus silvisoli TaxID=3110539 RepID=UPI002804B67B|nr:DUF418 domain-containing protein [Paenibacillus silvisoli]
MTTPHKNKRAMSLDLARGTMLLLIALAHAPLYLYNAEPGIMSRVQGDGLFDQIVNYIGMFLIDNRARAMFAVLFGYGLVMAFESRLSKGIPAQEAKRTIRRRCWYLILFGIALAVVIGGQDILMAYGLAGLLVGWTLTRGNRTLIRFTIILTLVYAVLLPFIWSYILQDVGGYGFEPEFTAADTYLHITLESLIAFPVIPFIIHAMFPILPPVLFGMGMARAQLLTKPAQRVRTLYILVALGLTISLLGALPVSLLNTVWQPDLSTAGLLYGVHILTGFAGGAAYAALFVIIGIRMKQLGWLTRALMALGKRSLTFYVWNEALLVLLLSPVALNLGGKLSNGAAAGIAAGVWGFSVLLAIWLEQSNRNGPLEEGLRRLMLRK